MKKNQNTDKSRWIPVATGVAAVVVAGVVLANSPKLTGIFNPSNFSQFINRQEQSEDYSALLGNGAESDLADQDADGDDSDLEQTQDVTKTARTDRVEQDDANDDALSLAGGNTDENDDTQTPGTLVGLGDTQDENGISVTPTGNTNGQGTTSSGTGGSGDSTGTSDNGNTNQNGGTNNGTNDNGTSDNSGTILSAWDEQQLSQRAATVTEDGTLVDLEAKRNDGESWVVCVDDSYEPADFTVTAYFEKDGITTPVLLSYGGSDGYSVSMSTKSAGTKTAVFTYKGMTYSKSYRVIELTCAPKYYVYFEGRVYLTANFPGVLNPAIWGNSIWNNKKFQENTGDTQVEVTISSGFKVDLLETHRQLIAYLSDSTIKDYYAAHAEEKGLAKSTVENIALLTEKNGYLTTMLTGFSEVNDGAVQEERSIYLTYAKDVESSEVKVVDVVDSVPEHYWLKLDTEGTAGGSEEDQYLGDQVLVWYDGTGERLAVPMGTTVVDIDTSKGTNTNVTAISIPESVCSTESFADIAKAFPNLKEYKLMEYSDGSVSENGAYQVIDGMLFSADGTTLVSVPPAKTDFDWSNATKLTTIAANAFSGCWIANLTLPSGITTLEDDCFDGLTAETITFEGDTPESVGDTGFDGKILVQDSENDRILKSWQFAFAENGEEITFGVVGDDGCEIEEKTDLYRHDSANTVLYASSNAKKLMAIPLSVTGSYTVSAKYSFIGSGAFADCESLGEVVFPELSGDSWTFEKGSLVFADSVTDIRILDDEAVVDSMAFGDPEENMVSSLTVYVPEEMKSEYLESWSASLDATYGEDTAKNLLQADEDIWLYENGGCYQRLMNSSGETTGWRLCSIYNKDMTAFAVKDGTAEIAENAFSDCANLEIIYLPDSVKTVGSNAFSGCTSLETVAVNANRASMLSDDLFDSSVVNTVQRLAAGDAYTGFVYEDGILYGQDADGLYTLINVRTDYTDTIALKDGTAYLGDYALKNCVKIGTESEDNATFLLKGVEDLRRIGAGCFENMTNLTAADFIGCEELVEIGADAFRNCTSLEYVLLPDGVAKVSDGLCYGCADLTLFSANSITEIGDEAFYNCMNLSVTATLPTESGETYSFMDCSKLTSIGDYAFAECTYLSKMTLPETLTYMGESCFENCTGLTEVTVNAALTAISRYCFSGCTSLQTLELGGKANETIDVIGVEAFSGCVSLGEVDFSSLTSLSELGQDAFADCSSLTQVKLPASVDSLPAGCFEGCEDLSILTMYGADAPELAEGVFGDADSFPAYLHIWVKEDAVSTYRQAYADTMRKEYGKQYIEKIVEAMDDTKLVIQGVTYQKTTVTDADGNETEGYILLSAPEELSGSYRLEEGTVEVAEGAFEGCSKLTTLLFPNTSYADNHISLGDRCFADCTGLTKIYLYGNIPEWGEETFAGDTALTAVYLGYTNTTIPKIGDRAFYGCTALTLVNMYASVDTIGAGCFENCTGLLNIGITAAFRSALTTIEDRAFAGCTSLQKFALTNYTSLKSIGAYAFTECDALSAMSMPKNLETLGEGCFSECDNLQYVSFYCPIEEFPDYCFYHCSKLLRTAGSSDEVCAALKRIGTSAYEGCSSLVQYKSFYLARYANLEEIGENAFKGCTSLSTYTDADGNEGCEAILSSTVTKIGAGAFDGCTALANLYLQSETPPAVGAMDVSSMASGFTLRVPDSESTSDSVYLAYLAKLEETMSAENALAILDSATDGAKARYEAAQTPSGENLEEEDEIGNYASVSSETNAYGTSETTGNSEDNGKNGATSNQDSQAALSDALLENKESEDE